MSDYQNIIDTIQEHNLSWSDIDRIELSPETYEEFEERASFDTSNYATNEMPAVRKTVKQEKLVYVSAGGSLVSVEL